MSHASRSSIDESRPEMEGRRRLGRNINGYRGETIDIDLVLAECLAAAKQHGWDRDTIPVDSQPPLIALRRVSGKALTPAGTPPPRVYISAGIHGDEPAAPVAIRQMLQQDSWPGGIDLWVCPCLNASGFRRNRRENSQGLDLNRQYLRPVAAETAAHIAWLEKQPCFDLSLCVHEDWESGGFYVYELNPDRRPSIAEAVTAAVGRVCPIEQSEVIEGRPARNGIIRPQVDPHSRPDWPEAFYLITHKSRLSYTLEAPSDFPFWTRVAALVQGVLCALSNSKEG